MPLKSQFFFCNLFSSTKLSISFLSSIDVFSKP